MVTARTETERTRDFVMSDLRSAGGFVTAPAYRRTLSFVPELTLGVLAATILLAALVIPKGEPASALLSIVSIATAFATMAAATLGLTRHTRQLSLAGRAVVVRPNSIVVYDVQDDYVSETRLDVSLYAGHVSVRVRDGYAKVSLSSPRRTHVLRKLPWSSDLAKALAPWHPKVRYVGGYARALGLGVPGDETRR